MPSVGETKTIEIKISNALLDHQLEQSLLCKELGFKTIEKADFVYRRGTCKKC